jgi:hypothetical protein
MRNGFFEWEFHHILHLPSLLLILALVSCVMKVGVGPVQTDCSTATRAKDKALHLYLHARVRYPSNVQVCLMLGSGAWAVGLVNAGK